MKTTVKFLLAAILLLAALPAFSQIPNDDCSTAVEVPVNTGNACDNAVFGTTLGAVPSGLGACNPQANDGWYRFVATAAVQDVRVFQVHETYYHSYPETYNLEIFSGSCGQLQHLYCVSQENGIRAGDLVPGETYYLRVTNDYNNSIEFLICVTAPDVPQPANDACANAILLPVDPDASCDTPVTGNTEYATASSVPACATCPPLGDVWYAFTATQATHIVTLSEVRNLVQFNEATIRLEVYTGTCGNLVSLQRNMNFFRQGSLLFNTLVPGQTYYLRFSGFDYYPSIPIQFNICVTSPPPPTNDACANALTIVPSAVLDCSEHLSGSLFGATSSGTDCQTGAVNDMWYQFIAGSPSQRVMLTPATNDAYGFEVYGGDCDHLASLTCATGNNLARTLTGLTAGATYYLRIFSPTYTAFDFQVCVLNLPPPPDNDECAGALPAPINPGIGYDLYAEGSTLGATSSQLNCGGTESTHDVWYSFVATGMSHRLLVYENNELFGNYSQFGYEVYQGDCGHLSSLACGHVAPNYSSETLLGALTPGNTYFVRVYSLYGSNHLFAIRLQTLPPPPVNSDCALAETLTSAARPNCGAPVVGNTVGIVTLEAGNCFSGKSLWYTFTATHTTEVVQLSEIQEFFGADYGYWLELYEGAGCGNLNYRQCYYRPTTLFLNHLTIGKSYYLRWGSGYYSAHSFKICLSHFDPPVNDDCTSALPLTVHGNMDCYYPTQGTTAGSTSGQPVGCLTNADVWFRFTAIQTTQKIEVSNIQNLENGGFEPLQAELLTGNCNNLNSLYCWPSKTGDHFTLLAGDLIPGQTYYLRLANAGDVPVRFQVCALTPPKPPVNDNCAQATILTPEAGNNCSYVSGNTLYASPTLGLPLPPDPVDGDVWYSFTAIQANQIISIGYINGYNDSRAVVEAYASVCGTFNLLTSKIITDNGVVNLTNLSPGGTYYVRVLPVSNPSIYFTICVSAPPVPDNDECAGALLLPISTDFTCASPWTVNTFGATQSQPDCDGHTDVDIWYQFTATDVTYRFNISDLTGHSGEGGLEVLSGDCDHPASLFCRALPALPTIFQEGGFIVGQTYYLRIWGQANTVQHWQLCVFALPPSPSNDDCANALPLPINSGVDCTAPILGTTLSATAALSACSGEPVQDIWYTFTATTASNLLNIEDLANYFGTYYAGYELLTGDCAAPNSVLCRTYVAGNYQEVLHDLTPGQNYYLRLFNFNVGAEDFSICLTSLPTPPNDDCANATPVIANPDLHCTTVYTGTTAGASFSGSFTTPDVWYTFTANSDALFLQLLNVQQYYGAPTALQYTVYHGNACDNWQLVGTYDGYYQARLGGLTLGDTYYIRVFPYADFTAHAFDLCLQTPPPPPPNDRCAGALPLTPNTALDCNIVTHGSTAGAVLDYSYACYSSGPLYDVWYAFTATSSVHKVEASNITALTTAGYNQFEVVVLQSTDCVNFTRLGCSLYGAAMYVYGLVPGQTYYVVAVSRPHVFHEFDLCVTTQPVPPNDPCENAVTLAVSPLPVCDNPTAGSAFGATNSGSAGCSSGGGDVWYTFTATQAAHTISVTNAVNPIDGSASYFNLEVLQNGCNNLQSLVCRLSQYSSTQVTVGELVPGTTYWIRVAGGNFNICVSTPPAPPANDGCAGATALAVSPDENCVTPTAGTTEFATASIIGSPNSNYLNDVWYSFTATQTNHAVVLSNFSTMWGEYLSPQLYSGVCGALSDVKIQGYTLGGQRIWLATQLTPGQTYYLRVFEGYFNQSSAFDICIISLTKPSNDECANALPLLVNTDLTCPPSTEFITFGATESAPDCAGNADNDVWYQFTATAPSCRLEINRTSYGTSGIFGLEILEGNCTAPAVVVPCITYDNYQALLLFDVVVGHTYYLRLSVPPADYKNFTICLRNLPPAPANDDCAQATVIQPAAGVDCDQLYNGTLVSASLSGTTCGGSVAGSVWYRFTATSTGHIFHFSTLGYPFGPTYYAGIEVYAGTDCAHLTSVGCFEYFPEITRILEGLTIGETYFIRVFSYQDYPYTFSFCVGTLPPVPANSVCADAMEVVPSPDRQCTQPVAGTTASLTDVSNQVCYNTTSLWYHFKATSSTHFIQLKNVVNQYGNASLHLGLYQGDCTFPHSLYCTDQREILATNLLPGADYYIVVGGEPQSGTRFDLCVLTPSPPANDHCIGAVMLAVSPTTECGPQESGNNLGATGSYGIDCNSGPDVWYAFIAIGPAQVVNISNMNLTNGTAFLEVLTGSCNTGWVSQLTCTTLYYNSQAITLNYLVPGQTYYLRLGSTFPSYCSFDICMTSPQPDLVMQYIQPSGNGCVPGNSETVYVQFANYGYANILENAAQFTLTVSGANSGTYGPVSNTSAVGYYQTDNVPFTGVDLSNSGVNQLTVTAVLPDDADVSNNANSRSFTSLPVLTFYRDADEDGYGNVANSYQNCFIEAGYVTNHDDCDDNASWIHPGATEYCNGVDDDCNGLVDAADPGLADAPLPGITCPDNISTVNDPGTCSAVVNYAVVTTDNCGYTVIQTAGLTSGEKFPVGTMLNTFTVSGPGGPSMSCSFSVSVQKTADPDLLYAYTVLGFNDVLLKNNTVQSGGVGLVNAGKKARLQMGTTVTAANTFVQAPVIELTGGSQVTTAHTDQVSAGILPAFQPNSTPTNNNVSIPGNIAPVTLPLASYGNLIIGINATVTFSGQSTVRIKELTVKDGAKVVFAQNTELLIAKNITIAKNVAFNAGGQQVQCFAGENVTIDRGTQFRGNIYTLKDLQLAKAAATAPTNMTGLFIASNVNAQDFVNWNWDTRCPIAPNANLAAAAEDRGNPQPIPYGKLQIAPNPASEEAQLTFPMDIEMEVTLQLLDAAGRLVQSHRLVASVGINQYRLDLGSLPEGLYSVQLVGPGLRETEKLVVLRP